ncbi:MAG TPA: type II toxin-antitoxin system HicB family antitoxin [Allosphingosinicella sp.]
MEYAVRLIPDGRRGVIATIPDVPEAVSRGATEDEAFDGAQAALEKALASYVEAGKPIPSPSETCCAPMVATDKFEAAEAGD